LHKLAGHTQYRGDLGDSPMCLRARIILCWELSNDFGDSGQFMTLFYLLIDHSFRSLRWVRAGHDPAILYNPHSDTFDELRGSGLPMGVDGDWRYEVKEKQSLSKDQIILIGTDGIWEAQNAAGELFGKEPVYEMIRQNATQSSNEILAGIIDELNRFKKGIVHPMI